VTGARGALPVGLPEFVARVREHTRLPLAVGIATPEQARVVGQIADGVIVGSARVQAIGGAARAAQAAEEFARDFWLALT